MTKDYDVMNHDTVLYRRGNEKGIRGQNRREKHTSVLLVRVESIRLAQVAPRNLGTVDVALGRTPNRVYFLSVHVSHILTQKNNTTRSRRSTTRKSAPSLFFRHPKNGIEFPKSTQKARRTGGARRRWITTVERHVHHHPLELVVVDHSIARQANVAHDLTGVLLRAEYFHQVREGDLCSPHVVL